MPPLLKMPKANQRPQKMPAGCQLSEVTCAMKMAEASSAIYWTGTASRPTARCNTPLYSPVLHICIDRDYYRPAIR